MNGENMFFENRSKIVKQWEIQNARENNSFSLIEKDRKK